MRSAPVSGARITFVRNTVILPEYGIPPCYEQMVTFSLPTPALYSFEGVEVEHTGRYELLPFLPDKMELVRASLGEIPEGRRPVEGGHNKAGKKLYHAVGIIPGVGIRVPGKTGEHTRGCYIGFGRKEYHIKANYEILCWKEQLPIQDCSA